jgi:hypothetical protein
MGIPQAGRKMVAALHKSRHFSHHISTMKLEGENFMTKISLAR